MEMRVLGSSGLEVSALGLGCMGMSEFYGPAEEKESLATFERAFELGVNFFDTADVYGPHRNEELVGRAVKERRRELVIATKFGIVRDPSGQMVGINGRPDYVKSACEASLKRLHMDVIDLYYQHRVDPQIPIEETVGAMAELVEEGKIRFVGLSEAPADVIRRANEVHPIAALQTEYSLWTRDPEGEILDTCRDLNIAFVAYSPLGRGFLTGAIKSLDDLAPDDWRRQNPRFSKENFEHNLEVVKRVEGLAADKSCNAAQIALAWVLAQGKDIIPIPGTKRRTYLEQNVGALEVSLSEDDLQHISDAFPVDIAKGDRYPVRT